jgi:hypothetical protein
VIRVLPELSTETTGGGYLLHVQIFEVSLAIGMLQFKARIV